MAKTVKQGTKKETAPSAAQSKPIGERSYEGPHHARDRDACHRRPYRPIAQEKSASAIDLSACFLTEKLWLPTPGEAENWFIELGF